jgi:hypothetical protein
MKRETYISILVLIMLPLILSLPVSYAEVSAPVKELPYDLAFKDAPGENYVIFGAGSFLADRFLEHYSLANLSGDLLRERSEALFSLIEGHLKPALSEANLSDDVFITIRWAYDPPILLVGVYNPDPGKVGYISSLLESYRSEYYNYTYIMYRMLTPISMQGKLRRIITNMSIVRSLYDLAGEVFNGWSFPSGTGGGSTFKEIRVEYLVGMDGGITIIVYKPNPTNEEISRWITGVRRYIPKDIPLIFQFREYNLPKIKPAIAYENLNQSNNQNQSGNNATQGATGTNTLAFNITEIVFAIFLGVIVVAAFLWLLRSRFCMF